ncbi:methyltransferase domain-containing protein [Candidatus Saccharibacteria bacterium]|nr:methyltransferase domain-containing protein [Candidatus Saccharibacteria bacterium]
MKRLPTKSQNFLRKPSLVKTLAGHSNLKKTDTVYDIGAGSGIISSVLAERCSRVIAVEHDARMITTLRDNVAKFDNVEVVVGDALTFALPDNEYKVFANIPFHLSSPIVRRLTETTNPPSAIYLIVQKQFAQKLLIGDYSFTGLLGAFIAPLFEVRIRYKLDRTDFWPHPAVDTVFIELLRRKSPLLPSTDMPRYRAFVEQCFSRQKYFATLGVGDVKPSEMTAEQWLKLFKAKGLKQSK